VEQTAVLGIFQHPERTIRRLFGFQPLLSMANNSDPVVGEAA
jgi:hypothetical protein